MSILRLMLSRQTWNCSYREFLIRKERETQGRQKKLKHQSSKSSKSSGGGGGCHVQSMGSSTRFTIKETKKYRKQLTYKNYLSLPDKCHGTVYQKCFFER
jgi:hypothetical protein